METESQHALQRRRAVSNLLLGCQLKRLAENALRTSAASSFVNNTCIRTYRCLIVFVFLLVQEQVSLELFAPMVLDEQQVLLSLMQRSNVKLGFEQDE